MGFSLKKLGKQIGHVVGGVEHGVSRAVAQANPLDNGRTWQNPQGNAPQQIARHQAPPSAFQQATHNGVTNFIGNAGQAVVHAAPLAFHAAQQATSFSNPIQDARRMGSALTSVAPHIPNFSNTSLLRFANNAIINPIKTTDVHVGQALQGRNPYHGTFGQQVGQAGQDAINITSVLPIGKGVQLATKGGALLPKVVSGAKLGAKAGAGFGAAQGVSTSLQNRLSLPQALKTTAINTGVGTLGGTALGAGAPLAGAGTKAVVKAAQNVKLPQVKLQSLGQEGKLRLPSLGGQNLHYSSSNGSTKVSGKADAVRAQLTKLNQAGAVAPAGGDARIPKPDTLKTTSGKQITETDFNKMIPISKGSQKISPQELADLSSKEQMALQQHTPLADPNINTAKNPFKASIPTVGHNDFGQVIANEQVASEIGKDNVLRSLEQLKKSSPEEYKNFWEHANGDPGFKDTSKSPQLQQALNAWRTADNRIHGNSQALGGNTNYLQDHGLHPVVFNEDVTNQLLSGADPNKFSGLHNLTRKHPTMASLRAAAEKGGFTVGTDPLSEANHYLSASENALRRRAIVKGVGEADGASLERPHTLVLGAGEKNRVDISQQAHDELRGLQRSIPTTNRVVKGARTANVATKSTLLSFGQFHPNNISLTRAAPTLALPKPSTAFYRNAEGKMKFDPTMSAHPVNAAKGLYATYRPLVPGSGTDFAAKVNARAVADGMDIKAARIGAPYNAQLFDASGSSIAGVGHKLLGRQMLGMHDQAVRSVISDLEKRGIPLDSEEARVAGKAVNNMMGFINNEAQKIPPVVSRQMGDWLLARQFTHSKFSQLRTGATQGGVGGAYARANVAANVAASTAVIVGIGYVLKQKSDSIRDALIRALTDPAIPTPLKDSRGNTVKLRIPGTDASDVAKLLGIKPVRQADGHLGISWKPGNMPTTVADFARARLAPIPGVALKVATNENYAGKPLYDPNAQFGTQVEQGATTALSGLLPIGAQGLPMVKAVEQHLPGNVQDVLNANKPGGNPLIKSLASSFGVTPTTDSTTGKGLESSRYFGAADSVLSQAKGTSEKTALQNYLGSKKNPVTGKYDTMPNSNDSQRKAKDLLDAPHSIDLLTQMNQKLNQQGSKTDPLWSLPKDQIVKVLQYQTYPYGGPDRKHWFNQNKDWYTSLSDQRSAFFNSLPKGDPNKPNQPIEYPSPSKDTAARQQTFFKLTDSGQRAKFLQENPDVQDQLDKQVEYNNNMRVATMGKGSELDTFPKADPGVQKIIDFYNKLPKHDGKRGGSKTRSLWIQAHPKEYAAMTRYFTQSSLYGLEQDAGQAMFKDTGFSSQGLKDISNVAKDVGTYKDANGNTFYALGGGGSGSSGGGGYSKYAKGGGSGGGVSTPAPYKYAVSLSAGGKIARPKVSVALATAPKTKLGKTAKPKVTLKKSKV